MTVQAGVLQLLRDLVDEIGLAVLLVTHDLGVMSAVADEVTVMRHGGSSRPAPRRLVLHGARSTRTRVAAGRAARLDAEQSPGSLVETLLEHPAPLPEESDDGR